jgi:regulator of sigma E protease
VAIGTILPGVLLLGIVIFVHELGHFLAAKWRGVTVLKFSLGMGPEMLGFTAGDGTRYCLSWIPLGGFVQMAGDSPHDDGTMPSGGQEEFLTHHWLGRIVIAVAGPAANLVTAYVVMVVMCLHGLTQPDFPNVVGRLEESTAAWRAGLRPGDRITAFGSTPVRTWHDLDVAAGGRREREPFTLTLQRGETVLPVEVPAADATTVLGDLGPESSPAVVGAVSTGMPAYRAGIQEGDRIVAVNGQPVERFEDISQQLRGKVDQPVAVEVLRGTKRFTVTVAPISADGSRTSERGIIGIEAPRGMTWVQHFTPGEAVRAGFTGTIGLLETVYQGMWLTVSRPVYYRDYVGGPIFIGQMARDSARKGLDNYLYLLAMINLAIMAFNLMPVPLLDGGHILLALLEAVRHRAISARTYVNFQKVGLMLVGTLFVFILSKDIVRPFQRMRVLDRAPRETTTVAPSHH